MKNSNSKGWWFSGAIVMFVLATIWVSVKVLVTDRVSPNADSEVLAESTESDIETEEMASPTKQETANPTLNTESVAEVDPIPEEKIADGKPNEPESMVRGGSEDLDLYQDEEQVEEATLEGTLRVTLDKGLNDIQIYLEVETDDGMVQYPIEDATNMSILKTYSEKKIVMQAKMITNPDGQLALFVDTDKIQLK